MSKPQWLPAMVTLCPDCQARQLLEEAAYNADNLDEYARLLTLTRNCKNKNCKPEWKKEHDSR